MQQYLGQAATLKEREEGPGSASSSSTRVAARETKEEERVSTGFQESPVGESQSNGVAENTVQQIQGHIRTIRDGLEE